MRCCRRLGQAREDHARQHVPDGARPRAPASDSDGRQIGVAASAKSRTARPSRMPKNTTIASRPRYPAVDQPLLQLAQLLRRARRHRAHALQRVDRPCRSGGGSSLWSVRADVTSPSRRSIALPPLGAQRHRAADDQQRDEDEPDERQQERHGYTSILMTWRIQKYPTACRTIAPISIICPMRSRNSSCM